MDPRRPARDYEAALAAAPARAPLGAERSGDDHYVIYTGGTTGLPKGVVWRQEDAFYACLGGGDPMRLQGEVTSPAELPDRIGDGDHLPAARAADARRRAVDVVHVVLLRRQGRAHAGLARPGRGVAHGRATRA